LEIKLRDVALILDELSGIGFAGSVLNILDLKIAHFTENHAHWNVQLRNDDTIQVLRFRGTLGAVLAVSASKIIREKIRSFIFPIFINKLQQGIIALT
jgi:hypothetical protein